MTANVTWSESERADLQRLWMAGESAGQISSALGRTRNSVIGQIKRMGLVRSAGVLAAGLWSPAEIELLTKLWTAGAPRSEVAQQLRRSENAVKKKAVDLDLRRPVPTKPQVPPVARFTGWDDDRTDRLIGLWRGGSSAGEIARAMGATRNAVTGKLDRLGLLGSDGRKANLVQQRSRSSVAKSKVIAMQPLIFGAASSTPKPPKPVSAEIAPPDAIPWDDRKPHHCAYPYGDRQSGFFCCPEPHEPGKSYCAGHDRVCVSGRGKVAA